MRRKMICKKCNEKIYSNDKCPFCGQLQSQPLENENFQLIECPNCKNRTPFEKGFCTHCGYSWTNKKNSGCGCLSFIIVLMMIFLGTFILSNNVKTMFREVNTTLEQIEDTEEVEWETIECEKVIDFSNKLLGMVVKIEEKHRQLEQIYFNYTKNADVDYLVRESVSIYSELEELRNAFVEIDTYDHPFLEANKKFVKETYLEFLITKSEEIFDAFLLGDADKMEYALDYFNEEKIFEMFSLIFQGTVTAIEYSGGTQEDYKKLIEPYITKIMETKIKYNVNLTEEEKQTFYNDFLEELSLHIK